MADCTPAPRRAAPLPARLAEYERMELRSVLMYHFEDRHDCLREFDDQLDLAEAVVERMLNRRAFASRAQAAIDGMEF